MRFTLLILALVLLIAVLADARSKKWKGKGGKKGHRTKLKGKYSKWRECKGEVMPKNSPLKKAMHECRADEVTFEVGEGEENGDKIEERRMGKKHGGKGNGKGRHSKGKGRGKGHGKRRARFNRWRDPKTWVCIWKKTEVVKDDKYNSEKAQELINNVYPEAAREDIKKGYDECFEKHGKDLSTKNGAKSYKNVMNCNKKNHMRVCKDMDVTSEVTEVLPENVENLQEVPDDSEEEGGEETKAHAGGNETHAGGSETPAAAGAKEDTGEAAKAQDGEENANEDAGEKAAKAHDGEDAKKDLEEDASEDAGEEATKAHDGEGAKKDSEDESNENAGKEDPDSEDEGDGEENKGMAGRVFGEEGEKDKEKKDGTVGQVTSMLIGAVDGKGKAGLDGATGAANMQGTKGEANLDGKKGEVNVDAKNGEKNADGTPIKLDLNPTVDLKSSTLSL